MKRNRQALIFSTVWPEPDSSAAGVRQMQWAQLLLELFDRVTLISPSHQKGSRDWGFLKLPDRLDFLPLPMNDWTIRERLVELNPELVLFDRFILEEQFGPLVYEALPEALILLETQDLHFVRRARESAKDRFLEMEQVPRGFYQTETALRETASLERVDFSTVVSSFEEKLLREEFGIGPDQQAWVPFFYEEPVIHEATRRGFSERSDFVWIGNFRHAPNVDGLRWFRTEIWPQVRKGLPHARLRIFGAYPSAEVMSWHSPQKAGIEVKGSAKTLLEVYQSARVNLAPLRFGAGVKGKILEGFRHGVPVVTTPVGLEGILPIGEERDFPGLCERDAAKFAEACIRLHEDENGWSEFQIRAQNRMRTHYGAETIRPLLLNRIKTLLKEKHGKNLPRWSSRMLRHELMNSRKYFSKWIEAKEKSLIRGSEVPSSSPVK